MQFKSDRPCFTLYSCCFVDELTWYFSNLGFIEPAVGALDV
jgi:hypothetical protein